MQRHIGQFGAIGKAQRGAAVIGGKPALRTNLSAAAQLAEWLFYEEATPAKSA